ncbi:MAG TPA: class I SAM-dependent methyltransferase [Burkholderiales bacterium]|nr:class I SAM-dependent methyltransferase [Burkholderiales bacterium]
MRLPLGIAALLAAAAVLAQSESPPPRDAPYFPTPQSVVERMLQLAKVGPEDFVIDLGSGDGRIVITAAKKYGARGIGIEIEPSLVSEANYYARRDGVGDRVKFVEQDLFQTDLRPATVLTLYLFRELNIKLAPRILAQLRPGARVVSHDWDLGDWLPDHQETMPAPDKAVGISRESKVFMWIVPARVQGEWRVETTLPGAQAGALRLKQRYQFFEGALDAGAVEGGRATGTSLAFTVAGPTPLAGHYEGTADGNAISGRVVRADGTSGTWRAVR